LGAQIGVAAQREAGELQTLHALLVANPDPHQHGIPDGDSLSRVRFDDLESGVAIVHRPEAGVLEEVLPVTPR
jgi:hypothetical protein